MHRPRQGSILILCLAIVATLSLLVYGFLRVVQLHQGAQNEVDKMLLAREAARMGTSHAIEQIIRDYISEPFTRMDGPARIPFVAHDNPYLATAVGSMATGIRWNSALGRYVGNDLDDCSVDRLLFSPLFSRWFVGSYDNAFSTFNWTANPQYPNGGFISTDGRGCYIEPGWYNRFAGPTTTAPAKLRFGMVSSASVPTALPDLNPDADDSSLVGAIFYDEHFRRMPATVDARTNRMAARYRLRYTVSVSDLDGELTINPDPAIDPRRFTSALPADYANPADARTVRASLAVPPIITAMYNHAAAWSQMGNSNCATSGGVKVEHVFLGRGFTGNFFQASGSDTPSTWPLMWRKSSATATTPTYQYFVNNPSSDGVPSSPVYQDYAPQLYRTGDVSASVTGGVALPLNGGTTMYKMLTGPQYSFFNFDRSEFSGMNDEALDWGRAWQRDGQVVSYGCLTPFGRGISTTQGAASTTASRFSGPVDTPWAVNVLTAPVQVLQGMIYGYMPPGAIAMFTWDKNTMVPYWMESRAPRDLFVTQINSTAFTSFQAPKAPASITPDDAVTPNYHIQHVLPTDPGYRAAKDRYPGEMGFNGVLSDGTWASDALGYYLRAGAGATPGAPKPTCTAGTISGEGYTYGAYDPYSGVMIGKTSYSYHSPHLPAWRYPPKPSDWQVSKAYNKNDEVTANGNIYVCTTAGISAGTGTGPSTTGSGISDGGCVWKFLSVVPIDNDICVMLNPPDSIWRAIGHAMSTAVSMARAASMSLNSSASAPSPISATSFTTAPSWPFTVTISSIADVDRLFLANLGIDIASPSGTTPTAGWYGQLSTTATSTGITVSYTSFTPGWNPASLYANLVDDSSMPAGGGKLGFPPSVPTASTADYPNAPYKREEYTAAMEMIINDFRVSFFGSSPAYTSFQALDLNGDGRTTCSALGSNAAATAREKALHIDCWAAATSVASSTFTAGMFSHTGCLTVTKSHFWRVMTRGEVWDNFYQTVAGAAELDTVLCVDPVDEAHEAPSAQPQDPALGQYSSHVIYQRWVHDLNRSSMSNRQ